MKPREWIWDFAVPSDSLKSCEAKRMDLGMRKLFDFAVPSDGLWSLGNGFVIYFVVRETSHGIEDQLLIVDQRKTLGSIVKSRLFICHQKSFVRLTLQVVCSYHHMSSKVVCSPNVESRLFAYR